MDKKIIAYIFNHNHNENCKLWLDRLTDNGIESYIIDSGSDEPLNDERVLKFPNLYYAGCFMKMCELSAEKNVDYVLQINDDILIDDENFNKMINDIKILLKERDDVGIYQPSTTEESHNVIPMNINKGTGKIRYTYRIEGWMGLIHKDILSIMRLIGNEKWKDGWGMDLLSSYFSWVLNKIVCVDDNVIVVHPKGEAGYSSTEADFEMHTFFKERFDNTFSEFEKKTYNLFKNKIIVN